MFIIKYLFVCTVEKKVCWEINISSLKDIIFFLDFSRFFLLFFFRVVYVCMGWGFMRRGERELEGRIGIERIENKMIELRELNPPPDIARLEKNK